MNSINPLIERYKNNIKYYAGYPQNVHFDYSEIYEALSYPINNYGDPFLLQNPVSSHEYEQEVIKWFLRLYGLKETSLGWGYVTSGGSEGILFGLWQAKENLKNPVLYFSEFVHYCVLKFVRIMGIDYRIIKSLPKGEMDYNDFDEKLVKNRDAIVIATIGNTVTSAIDDVRLIRDITDKYNVNTFIHADAAFDGMILPFIETNHTCQLTDQIDSISVSGHKIIGSPIPCGVVLIHKKYVDHFRSNSVELINNVDCSITGSRPGFSSLILWDAIAKNKRAGFKLFIEKCLQKASEFTKVLNDNGVPAWRFDHAMTIVLDKLPVEITRKWRAPSSHNYTTLTALPKLTESMLNELIDDIKYFKEYRCLKACDSGIVFPKVCNSILLDDD